MLDVEELSGDKPQVRLFKCWIEDEWEREALSIKSTSNEILLRNKYGGVKYYNCDHGFEAGTIDRGQIWYSLQRGDQGVYVTGVIDEPVEGGEKEEEWMIGEDLFFMICCYYKHNPTDPYIKIVTYSQYMEMGDAEDEAEVDAWIANGGRFPPQPPASRPQKASVRKRAEKRKKKSSNVPKELIGSGQQQMSKKGSAAKKYKSTAIDDSSSDEESDSANDIPTQPKKLGAVRNEEVVLSSSDDSSGSDTEE